MDFKYYTSVLVVEPGVDTPRQYNGVITMNDPQPASAIEDAVGAAICRALELPRDKVRVLHCARIH